MVLKKCKCWQIYSLLLKNNFRIRRKNLANERFSLLKKYNLYKYMNDVHYIKIFYKNFKVSEQIKINKSILKVAY